MMILARCAIEQDISRCARALARHAFTSQTAAPHDFDTIHRQVLEVVSNNRDQVSNNVYDLHQHGKDESYHPVAAPNLVVYPRSVTEIQGILAIARQYRVPIIPYGAGTSVEGHINAIRGGISMDMKHFDTIQYHADTAPNLATVGAGVTRMRLNDALRHTGYWFPVDPGADASLGGMMATAASGTTAVRYGTMREAVVAVQCILADGTLVSAGTMAPKNAAGYNLGSILTGSEGTLGVITHLTVKLRPVLEHKLSAVAVFDNLHDAANVAADLQAYEIPILRCELLDASSVQAFNDYSKQTLNVKPTIFLEFQSFSSVCLQEQLRLTRDVICSEAISFECGNDRSLWTARHKLYYAAIAARPEATGAITTDACVPLSQFATLIATTVDDVQASNVVGPCFGHAGDGNMHCILPVGPNDRVTGYLDRVLGIRERLAERAIAAGGTVTGEHGVGSGKIHYLARQYGKGAIQMMQKIKDALDPLNIMNPGKVLEDQS